MIYRIWVNAHWRLWSIVIRRKENSQGVDDFPLPPPSVVIEGVELYHRGHILCEFRQILNGHYHDVIMGVVASQVTSLTHVYSTVYSDADQRKHQSSASLAFVRGIHRRPANSPHKWPVTRKMFPFDDVIMKGYWVCNGCISYIMITCRTATSDAGSKVKDENWSRFILSLRYSCFNIILAQWRFCLMLASFDI